MQHGSQTQNRRDGFLPPHGPIERIVRVIARLGRQDNVCRFARAMLQVLGRDGVIALGCLVV